MTDFAEAARTTMSTACAAADLDDQDARLLHVGASALFHLPEPGIVVRVGRPAPAAPGITAAPGTLADAADDLATLPSDGLAEAQRTVDIAEWLARQQFPAVRTADIRQPSEVDGHPVTFWRYQPGAPAERTDTARLGAALWILHGLERPEAPELPEHDLIARLRTRVRTAEVAEEQRTFLLTRLDELAARVAELTFPLEAAFVHGAPKLGHVIVDGDRTTLIDFTAAGWGQPEWDLALLATEHDTTGRLSDAEYAAFTDAYGWDVTTWPGYPTLQAVQQLNLATQP